MAVISPEQAKKYFSYPKMRKRMWWCIVAAVLLGAVEPILFPLFAVIAALIWHFKLKDCPTDQDIEDTFEAFVLQQEPAALDALNYEFSDLIRPSDWFWYVSRGINGCEKRFRVGKDDITRANTRSFIYVLYGADQIMSYEIDYNIEEAVESTSNNSEYFYQDVAGVEVNPKALIIRSSGGNKVFPLVEADEEADEARAKGVMNAIRTMLREKKSSPVAA